MIQSATPNRRSGVTVKNGNCILKISGIHGSLKAAERRLADYILKNVEEAANLTLEELIAKSESSLATVYRFIRRLGFAGFKEFKAGLVQSIIRGDAFESRLNTLDIEKTASTERICADACEFSCRIIKDCASIIDPRVIDQAVNLMFKADSVQFIGSGTSNVSATYAYNKFLRLGVNCGHEPIPTFFRMRCALMTERDVLFAISSSGRTKTVVEAAKLARANGAKVIGLSDFAISPLTRLSTLNLHTTPRNVGAFMNIDLPLIIGQITILDILHLCYSAKAGEKARRAFAVTKVVADKEKG